MKDDKDVKDDLIVDIDEAQLALPIVKDELEVEIKPEVKSEEVKVDSEPPKKERKRHNEDVIKSLEAQIKAKDGQLASERQARAAAEAARERAASEASQAKAHSDQSYRDVVAGRIAEAKSHEERIKREMKQALEMGEHDRFTDLQMEAARIAARKLQYEDAKVELDSRPAKPERVETEVRQPAKDPVEDYIQSIPSTKSQSWLRQHKECVTDPYLHSKVMYGHQEAIRKGIVADSQEYFAHLDQHMGYADVNDDDDGDDEGDEVEVATPQRKSMASAPPSRDSVRQTGQLGPGKYRLTREEAAVAESMGLTATEYATHKVKMIKEGRWTN
jgi:hypothetical protein